ncbi:MAG: ribbon-helix-helix domain-containing protein [bacterium]
MSRKSEIITFKADESLLEALQGIHNRSDFIRSAVLAALENSCPMCGGTGLLTPNQRRHWERFARSHELTECNQCHELHLVCERERGGSGSRKVHV